MADRGYLIGETVRKRLRDVVEYVEGLPRESQVARVPTVLEDGTPYLDVPIVRRCSFISTWPAGESKIITLLNAAGATQAEVFATNTLVGVSAGTGFVARDGSDWKLISVDLTTQPGYSTSGTKVLTLSNGLLQWTGTTACT